MIERVVATLLERAFGADGARSILGDLEEDLTRGRSPRWARRATGPWLLWQAAAYVIAARWAGHAADPPALARSRRSLEVTTMWYDVRHAIRSLRSAPTFTIVATHRAVAGHRSEYSDLLSRGCRRAAQPAIQGVRAAGSGGYGRSTNREIRVLSTPTGNQSTSSTILRL